MILRFSGWTARVCESAAEEEEGGGGGSGGGGGGGVQDTFHTLVHQQLPPVVLLVAREGGREGLVSVCTTFHSGLERQVGWKFYLAGPQPPLSSPAGCPTTATLPQAQAVHSNW